MDVEEIRELLKQNPQGFEERPSFVYRGVALFEMGSAFPEQYDAKDESGTQIGYLRLRGGLFRVHVPDYGGVIVYSASPKGQGSFENEEREDFLMSAIDAILLYLNQSQ
jgi:hypothetical protein